MSASLAPVLRVLGFGAAGRCTDARAPANSAPLPPALARLPAACPTAGWARGWSNTHPLRASGRGIPGRPGRPSRSGRGRAAAVGEAPGSGEKPGQVVFNHEVVHRIAAPVDRSWVLWSDLSRAPEWMRWIERVEVVEAGGPGLPPRLSRWVCSTGGFEVSWVARVDNIKGLEDHKEPSMEWATIEGLQSTGKVVFAAAGEGETDVTLTVSHSLPSGLGDAIGASGLDGLVKATLMSDLERFSSFAEAQHARGP